MKKYLVSCSETLFYAAKEIKANSVKEAEEKYIQLWDAGMIEVNHSEAGEVEVKEL